MREPVRIYSAVMAGWLVLLGGSAFTDLLPRVVTGLLILGTSAVQVGVGEYTRSKVTPIPNVTER
jgi:hypothetical protein